MGHCVIVVRDGEKRWLRVYNNVLHKVSVSLSREDVVHAFSVAYRVEGTRDTGFVGTENGVHQGEIMVGRVIDAHRCHFALHSVHYQASHLL